MKTLICTMWVCLSFVAASAQTVVNVIDKGIRYCESTYPYNDGLLIANFGTEQLNPLNTEGKGYIVLHKDGKNEVLIPADGHLSAPKGMLVRDGYLYVCDVNKVMVYNLADKAAEPRTIALPKGNLFANDLVSEGDYLYVSVTNTDRMRTIQIGISMLVTADVVDYGQILAGATVAILPSALIYIFGQDYIIRGMTAGGVKG